MSLFKAHMFWVWSVTCIPMLWGLWYSWRYAWWRPTVSYEFPRILMYHMIACPRKGSRYNGMRVSPAAFEEQIKWLRNEGWSFHTVSELLESETDLPRKSVAITFDDGYADNALVALPILRRYQAKATVYVIVGQDLGDWSSQKKEHHHSGELLLEPRMNEKQWIELVNSGLIELGSHTMTHCNFLKNDHETILQELVSSKQRLEEVLGLEVKTFAYPFGLYKFEDVQPVSQAGYHNAVTTERGMIDISCVDRFRLNRIKISGKEGLRAFKLRVRTGWRGVNK